MNYHYLISRPRPDDALASAAAAAAWVHRAKPLGPQTTRTTVTATGMGRPGAAKPSSLPIPIPAADVVVAAAAAAAVSPRGGTGTLPASSASLRMVPQPLAPPRTVMAGTRANRDLDGHHSNQRSRNQFRPRTGNGAANGGGSAARSGATSYQLRQYAEATLGGGSLRKVVRLPEGEDENEWLAVNMVDFYNQINLLYGAITEFCSPQSCPEMKATDEFEYLWQDGDQYKKPTKMPAPEYIEQLMAWVQGNIDNEAVLPSRIGVPFPKSFPSLVRQIFKRMYRVYAHIYCHHYPVVRELGLEPHLNTSFKQYVLFIDEHNLATGKDFWGPLGDLVESMLRSD